MQIHNLSENNSVLNHFLGQIRNVNIHKDSMRFRRNIERIGEIMAYELSKELHSSRFRHIGIKTQLKLLIISYLFYFTCWIAVLNYFDAAQNGFISSRYQ
jgi:uracil phosphoribosyltransferase